MRRITGPNKQTRQRSSTHLIDPITLTEKDLKKAPRRPSIGVMRAAQTLGMRQSIPNRISDRTAYAHRPFRDFYQKNITKLLLQL